MDSGTMRRLCQYLHELRSGRRNNNGTGEHPSANTTGKIDVNWNKGNVGGNGRRNKHNKG